METGRVLAKSIAGWLTRGRYFVLVVMHLGRRYLLVHERKHGQLWHLPGGVLFSRHYSLFLQGKVYDNVN